MLKNARKYVLDSGITNNNPVEKLMLEANNVKIENGVTASYLLHTTYDELYTINPGEYSKATEDALGPVLYRSAEEIIDFTPINNSIMEFISFDINKIFGYNLSEYMALTKLEQMVIIEKAKEIQAILAKETAKEGNTINKVMNEFDM